MEINVEISIRYALWIFSIHFCLIIEEAFYQIILQSYHQLAD